MTLTTKQIEEIAELLDCGMKCYYNIKTEEIKSILDADRWMETDDELWENELEEIENNRNDYVEFEGMS